MSLKDMLQNAIKQTNNYIESTNIKGKIVEVKDKTIDKVKGIDNPEHYTAPLGFTLFSVPVTLSDSEEEINELSTFFLKKEIAVVEAYSRLITLLLPNETIINAITATMKRTYLIVHTNKDRIFIVHKECYKVLTREEIKIFKFENTSVLGMTFTLNEYQFVGKEKSKIYSFIRKYCYETTPQYVFQQYTPVTKNLNYYERFKYEILNKENQAVEENKMLVTLLETFEFPLASVFGTCDNSTYILMVSTNGRVFLINDQKYTIINMDDVLKLDIVTKGVFSSEFFMDNYYFVNGGTEHSLLKIMGYFRDKNVFLQDKDLFLESHKILMTFPFEKAISFQTPSGESFVIDERKEKFLINLGLNKMEMYEKKDFLRYELTKSKRLEKSDMWSSGVGKHMEENFITKEEAIENYEIASVRIYLQNDEEPRLELPLMLIKKVVYNEIEEVCANSKEVIASFFEELDRLKVGE